MTGKKLTKRSDKMDGASAEKNFFEREQLPSHKPVYGSFAIMEQRAECQMHHTQKEVVDIISLTATTILQ